MLRFFYPVGTGIIYLLDTTDYTYVDGQLRFEPKLIRDWEIPWAEDHCYGVIVRLIQIQMNGCCFLPTTLDSAYFETDQSMIKATEEAGMLDYTSHITTQDFGF